MVDSLLSKRDLKQVQEKRGCVEGEAIEGNYLKVLS
jgi:hypothetical protein